MIVYREKDYMEDTPIREHPWKGGNSPEVDYYDFRKHPELIREKLEDFKPWEHFAAIETFYRLLEFLFGDTSEIESNDCAFHGPQPNISTNTSPKKLECKGRLMVFYRRLPNNINAEAINWFLEATAFHLQRTDDPSWKDGVVGIGFMDTAYVECNRTVGKEVVLQFWVFGNTDVEVFENLDRLFKNVDVALRGLSDEIAEAINAQRGIDGNEPKTQSSETAP